MKLTDSVSDLKGIGPKKKEIFHQHDIFTIEDLINYFPRKYEDRREAIPIASLKKDDNALIVGKILSKRSSGNSYKRNSPLRLLVDDGSGRIEIIFFNGKFISNAFNINCEYSFYGTVDENYGGLQMVHPEFHKQGDSGDIRGIVPVYPMIQGISQNEIRKLQKLLEPLHENIEEWLPEEVVKDNKLASPAYAVKNIHFPLEKKNVLISKFRLIFEELLILETGLFYIKSGNTNNDKGPIININSSDEFVNNLPFKLTSGQEKVWKEIGLELESPKAMNRLVQGDVGSGKTAIAEIAMYSSVKSGYQAVMMAPTELLAKQHFQSLKEDFEPYGVNVGLLCSGLKASEKKETLEALENGNINILVGTHAIIQPNVVFNNLGLVITDEQHRFGVKQRKLLSEKGENPNVLVMTATPIPRTLAVILYGDLDVSIIDTMPVGRKAIKTVAGNNKSRNKIYDFVKKELANKHQAYVVAPLIEESESIEAKSAEELYKELSKNFKDYKIALIHGAMKQEEKDSIMERFASGDIDVLVSTVVIEVGINVPNATVMVIENSERFGLAQMHQLRGRVGRSNVQSYCFLICEKDSEVAKKRAKIMCDSTDGFKIAEEDLVLRGPGEIFGTRQHGLPEMHLSDLVRHVDVLEKAKNTAKDIINNDPNLSKNENAELKRRVEKMFGSNIKLEL